jgi:hypothetical protein
MFQGVRVPIRIDPEELMTVTRRAELACRKCVNEGRARE